MIIKWAAISALLGTVAASAYLRLAAIPAKHFEPRDYDTGLGEYTATGSSRFVLPAVPDAQYQRLMEQIVATPRVTEQGSTIPYTRVFIARSWLWGFPDVIHVTRTDGGLILDGHLVYGYSDMGVNRRRIMEWLKGAGIDPLT